MPKLEDYDKLSPEELVKEVTFRTKETLQNLTLTLMQTCPVGPGKKKYVVKGVQFGLYQVAANLIIATLDQPPTERTDEQDNLLMHNLADKINYLCEDWLTEQNKLKILGG